MARRTEWVARATCPFRWATHPAEDCDVQNPSSRLCAIAHHQRFGRRVADRNRQVPSQVGLCCRAAVTSVERSETNLRDGSPVLPVRFVALRRRSTLLLMTPHRGRMAELACPLQQQSQCRHSLLKSPFAPVRQRLRQFGHVNTPSELWAWRPILDSSSPNTRDTALTVPGQWCSTSTETPRRPKLRPRLAL